MQKNIQYTTLNSPIQEVSYVTCFVINLPFSDYFKSGFLALQRAIDNAIILYHNASANLDQIQVNLNRFPYPSYIIDT